MPNREGMPYVPEEEDKKEDKARPGGFMKKARSLLGVAALGAASLGNPAEAEPAQLPQTELAPSGEKETKSAEYFWSGEKIDILASKSTAPESKKEGQEGEVDLATLLKEFGASWSQENQTLTLPGGGIIDYRKIDERRELDPDHPGWLRIDFDRRGKDEIVITYYIDDSRQEVKLNKYK